MRVVVAVIAALVTLGLAAFGVVAAQKAAGPSSIIALAARVISPGQNTGAAQPASQPAQPQAVQPRVSQAPVVQVAQANTGAQTGAIDARGGANCSHAEYNRIVSTGGACAIGRNQSGIC